MPLRSVAMGEGVQGVSGRLRRLAAELVRSQQPQDAAAVLVGIGAVELLGAFAEPSASKPVGEAPLPVMRSLSDQLDAAASGVARHSGTYEPANAMRTQLVRLMRELEPGRRPVQGDGDHAMLQVLRQLILHTVWLAEEVRVLQAEVDQLNTVDG